MLYSDFRFCDLKIIWFNILKPYYVWSYYLSEKIDTNKLCINYSLSKVKCGAWIICLMAPKQALLAVK